MASPENSESVALQGPDAPSTCVVCASQCSNPFDRLIISYLVRGETVVHFTLLPSFTDPLPYSFQLQVGQTNNQDANDWTDVGSPVDNTFYAVDPEQRIQGKIRWQFYRVQLTTNNGTYYSQPTGLGGTLSFRDWRLASERLRQETVRMRQFAGQLGYLLKRRVTGTPCPVCLDYITEEVRNPYCSVCYGTGFECGYFFPMGCVWADIDPMTYHLNIDAQRGTVNDVAVKARMLNTWLAAEEDIWVNKVTDDRYYLHSIRNTAEIRGVPLVASVEMRPIPASDPVYSIIIPDQLLALPRDNNSNQRLI